MPVSKMPTRSGQTAISVSPPSRLYRCVPVRRDQDRDNLLDLRAELNVIASLGIAGSECAIAAARFDGDLVEQVAIVVDRALACAHPEAARRLNTLIHFESEVLIDKVEQ